MVALFMAASFSWMELTKPEFMGFAFMSCMEPLQRCSIWSVSIRAMI